MRISDWSSDVCSSDLVAPGGASAVKPGEVDRSHKGEAAPTVTFTAPAGKTVTLADFKGTPVLLNLWATWCAPGVADRPTLDALAVPTARRSAVWGTSVSARVELGGRQILNKKRQSEKRCKQVCK